MKQAVRHAAAAVALLCFLGAAYFSGRAGLSRLSSDEAMDSGSLGSAERAVGLAPHDPDAHYARAIALVVKGDAGGALKEYERAAALRPLDSFLWLAIGSARDEAGDEGGAIAAYSEAVRLAPYYAEPRWQLGNVLLRAGRLDEAVAELRSAAMSNPALLPNFIDLAWGASAGDARAAEQIVRPETDEWRLALARFLVKKGKTTEALSLFRAAGAVSEKERTDLLQELLTARRYREAYEVWLIGQEEKGGSTYSITDPGFESQIKPNAPGFGWRVAGDIQSVKVSIDRSDPRQGESSLRLDWGGDANPSSAVVSQLVLVEPNSRYRLSFAARSEELVTGGPPLIVVSDKSGKDARDVGRSDSLAQDGGKWLEHSVEFSTAGDSTAVAIELRRQGCSGGTCPIFGRLWLDDFNLKKL